MLMKMGLNQKAFHLDAKNLSGYLKSFIAKAREAQPFLLSQSTMNMVLTNTDGSRRWRKVKKEAKEDEISHHIFLILGK